jgi:hypothetical protein
MYIDNVKTVVKQNKNKNKTKTENKKNKKPLMEKRKSDIIFQSVSKS